MVFAVRLLEKTGALGTRERRTLRLRNHLYRSPYWERVNATAAEFAEILAASLRKGVAAAKRIAFPALVIQSVMLAVALSYFFYPPASEAMQSFVRLKNQMGSLVFSFLSMGAIAVFVEVMKRSGEGKCDGASRLLNGAYAFVVFGCLGIATDLFYLGQNALWSGLPGGPRVLAKVLTDQFLYTVIFANPYQTFLYVLKDCGFNRQRFLQRITPFRTFYVREVLAVLITNWAFWIPTTCIIYILPLDLQLVISRLAVLIWVLLLSAITAKEAR